MVPDNASHLTTSTDNTWSLCCRTAMIRSHICKNRASINRRWAFRSKCGLTVINLGRRPQLSSAQSVQNERFTVDLGSFYEGKNTKTWGEMGPVRKWDHRKVWETFIDTKHPTDCEGATCSIFNSSTSTSHAGNVWFHWSHNSVWWHFFVVVEDVYLKSGLLQEMLKGTTPVTHLYMCRVEMISSLIDWLNGRTLINIFYEKPVKFTGSRFWNVETCKISSTTW